MIECEIYFEIHWESSVKVIPSAKELVRISLVESREPPFKRVVDVFV